ncbi:RNA polymerase sigma factor [Lunatibacter salilacus]|uniref:RNA polymerase sigma factor n=1 Tax=Lunatibacter salilacus TaxID=2483804 RepID=UPI00131C02A8|nr:sigma-70 family RNA polymerase sigma factor [Lunatibacter salilacus]
MNFQNLGEVEIWKLIEKGNEHAFAFIYQEYSDDLFKYGYKFTQNQDLIEDVIQDVYVVLWEQRTCIQIQRSIKYYLFSAFRRDLIRHINFSYQNEPLEEYHSKIAWEKSFMDILEENQVILESKTNLSKALEILPTRQKEAIYLRYIHEMAYNEISDLMGLQMPSLYNLIFRALKTLKENLHSV